MRNFLLVVLALFGLTATATACDGVGSVVFAPAPVVFSQPVVFGSSQVIFPQQVVYGGGFASPVVVGGGFSSVVVQDRFGVGFNRFGGIGFNRFGFSRFGVGFDRFGGVGFARSRIFIGGRRGFVIVR